MEELEMEERYYHVNGVCLHVMEAGDPKGDVLLFLHGFPEFWYGWRKQIGYFSRQGFRVIVPDQRGYNLSSKPPRKNAYLIEVLSNDIAALLPQLGSKKVFLIGHDWGGAVAWAVAIRYPELLEKLIVLNLPHPQIMRETLKRLPKQLLKSWYIGFFQLPFFPEKMIAAFGYRLLSGSMRKSAKEGTFSREELERYKEAWKKSGAIKSMINWYRAARLSRLNLNKEVVVPTLLIWGKKDAFLSHEMARPSIEKCRNGRLEMVEDATHWIQHEKAEYVNQLIHGFVSK